jgi:hypothetical protein
MGMKAENPIAECEVGLRAGGDDLTHLLIAELQRKRDLTASRGQELVGKIPDTPVEVHLASRADQRTGSSDLNLVRPRVRDEFVAELCLARSYKP